MAETGIERTLLLLSRLMSGERLSIPGLLEEDSGWTDGSLRRSMSQLEAVPGVHREAGRPANWVFKGAQPFNFCPHCGKTLPR